MDMRSGIIRSYPKNVSEMRGMSHEDCKNDKGHYGCHGFQE